MAESATPAGGERRPEEGIRAGPKPVPEGRPPELPGAITRHPGPGEFRSLQARREGAGPPGRPPPGSEVPRNTSELGWASPILGAAATCAIGFGVLLLLLTGARQWEKVIASLASICLGAVGLMSVVSQQAQREGAGPPGRQPPGSEAPTKPSGLGWASVSLGAVAIGAIGFGFLLFIGARSLDMFIVWLAAIGLSPVLTLPGMALGLASLAQKGRSTSAGVVGCWTNGLLLGVWLFLFAISRTGWWQPGNRAPPVAPFDAGDFFGPRG